jgi:hypothetical protein
LRDIKIWALLNRVKATPALKCTAAVFKFIFLIFFIYFFGPGVSDDTLPHFDFIYKINLNLNSTQKLKS